MMEGTILAVACVASFSYLAFRISPAEPVDCVYGPVGPSRPRHALLPKTIQATIWPLIIHDQKPHSFTLLPSVHEPFMN